MNMRELPKWNKFRLRAIKIPKFRIKKIKLPKNKVFWGAVILVIAIIALLFSVANQPAFPNYLPEQVQTFLRDLKIFEAKKPDIIQQVSDTSYTPDITYEQAIINAVKSSSPSVVSIIISKNVPIYEQQWVNPFGDLGPGFNVQIPQYVQKGTELQEIGAGSGFIVSAEGLVLTNKHVVLDSSAEYTIFTSDGQKYPAKVLALDPAQDLAVVKIQSDPSAGSGQIKTFQPATLGDSSKIQIGQTAIAIGNALGEFNNTVSVGVVSGLQRTVSASDRAGGFSETLQGIIQTDAAINSGNSGGPLLNLKGQVIGINTAMAEGAQNVGFAIPINMAKRAISQIIQTNKIVYPFLGIRYVLVDSQAKQKYNLQVDYGAMVLKGANGEPAVMPGSGAQNAGIKEGDIILQVNGEKVTAGNPLSDIILKYNPGDKITLKLLRSGSEINVEATLGERSS